MDDEIKKKVIKETADLISERYIEGKMAKKLKKKILEEYEKGFFDTIESNSKLALELNNLIHETCNDKHLYFLYNKEMLEVETALQSTDEKIRNDMLQVLIEKAKNINYGFRKIEILDGNIGYLDLIAFQKIGNAFETASAAMNFLRNTKTIIIDLRNNGGGETEMVQFLASYFLKELVDLNYIKRRYNNGVEQYRALSYVPGGKMLDKELFLLTSANTFSAAEDFLFALQNQKRATIIGEQTKGGGHPVDFIPIQNLFLLMLPTGEAFNPTSKATFESIGVEPDVKIAAEDAFSKAYLLAIETAIPEAKDVTERKFLELTKEEMISKTCSTPNIDLSIYDGTYDSKDYGLSNLKFEENKLYWKTANAGKVELVPLTEKLFKIKAPGFETISIILEKTSDEILLHFFYKRERDIITKRKSRS